VSAPCPGCVSATGGLENQPTRYRHRRILHITNRPRKPFFGSGAGGV
jgi:hypothetical protein